MIRLAAAETNGRSRFERKLLLAEVCLSTNRERLARAVLEELAEQIETHRLDTWESSELISGVWTRLYQIYKRSGNSDEAEKLYGRLCRLDPWQALACSE
jgi:type VI secretion system protein ImpA